MTQKISYEKAILALVLNFFILPGLGTIIGGRRTDGFVQMGLSTSAFFFIIIYYFDTHYYSDVIILLGTLSFLGLVGTWIWGIVLGIRMVWQAKKRTRVDVADAAERGKNSLSSYERAMLALVLNFFILPGLGTIIGGRRKEGFVQIGFMVPAAFLLYFNINPYSLYSVTSIIKVALSILVLFGIWIWGIVSGINIIRQAKKHTENKTDFEETAERERN